MASKKEFPDWSNDNIKWYMLSNEEPVGRIRHRKNAPAGRIFQVDEDDPDKSRNDGIELKSCEKGEIRVKWRPGVFYGLDDDFKEMLIAVEEVKERLWIFEEDEELLFYAKQLKIGDKVDVRVPAKKSSGIVQGTVKYIGPKDSKTPGKYFGIQLYSNLDDSVGVNYFWCKGAKGVMVAVNKIQPPYIKKHDSKPRTRRDQKPSGEYKMNDDADVGVKDAVKPPYIMGDDDVIVHVMLTSCTSRKQWVKGKVVFVKDNHLAVNVDSTEGRVLTPWKGLLHGKKVFTNYTSQTAWVERSDVQILHDKPLHHENSSSSTGPSNKKQSGGTSSETFLANQPRSKGNSDRKSYPGIAQQVEPQTKHQLADDGQCEKEGGFKVYYKKGKKPNQHKPGSVEMSSMASGSDHRIPSGTMVEEERCTSDTKKSWTTRITSYISRADPPPYPFSVYEVQAIVADSKLCHGLISELELTNKWRASTKKEQKDFFKLESVLQSWWKDIHEGHQAHLQSFLMFLGQYGREDIRDHIEKVPDRGCFDETVLNTVILSATNSWKLFAAELGVEQRELTGKLSHDMNTYDCLRTVFDIWYTKEKGCNKLGQLLKACRAIGRETLADEIEQGLSESVLRRISRQIETKQWRLLGEKLRISEVRLDAFRESFQLLPERVYRMLSYWSMLQSFDVNKIEMLASVLYDIDLGHVAEKELYKVPDRGCFDETVLNTVILSVTIRWKLFAAELGVEKHELAGKVTQDMNPYDCLRIVFDIWNTNEKGCNKLGQLLKACRAIGRYTLADEIEQGLNESVLRRISRQIQKEQWKLLGEKLLISDVRLDAFREAFKLLSERVYRMFSYWSMLQSFDANKIEMLASVLRGINLGHVAEKELYKGLRQHELESTAALLSDNWQNLAPVLVKSQDIDYIMEQKGDSSRNCFRMLSIWRGRQIQADDVNLKETLFQAMSQCNLYREARQLYDGLDPYTVMELSVKLLFDWPLLASSFGYDKGEIAQRMRGSNQAEMALKMLNEWLNANKDEDPRKTKEKLLKGFVTIRRADLVEWLQNRDDDVCEVSGLKQTAKKAPESKRLTRMNMQKVAEKLRLNQQQLMDMLTLNHEDLKRYKTDSVKEDLLAVMVAWKKKQLQWFGELETFENLQKLLQMYEHREALAELSDGSSVDPPEVTNRSGGAVGGVPPEEPPYPDLTLDSLVEVNYGEQTLSGVIAWIGEIKGIDGHGILAGVELDDYLDVGGTDGTFSGTRCFDCQYGKGLILPLSRCKPDSRFLTGIETFTKKEKLTKDDFGGKDCEPVEGNVDPPKNVDPDRIGMFKGIQGDHNSCYMDVTLFSMFAYNSVFDAILLYDESTKEDILEIKNVLRRTIVNPLRSIGYVRADYVLHFRDLLSGLSSMKGLRTEEKDPEEFIHALLQELLNAKPFLQISQGKNATMESFVYQIFLDKQDNLDTSTVSDLLHLSFLQSDLKLAKVPECLIIQLPRYGKKYKLYDWIIPSLEMDINALIRDSPRQCSDCGKLAFVECKDCEPVATDEDRDVIQSFCKDCYFARHDKKKHKITNLSVPLEVAKKFQEIAEKVDEDDIAEKTQHLYPEHRMELFSVVCIETSHYVAFVKTGSGDGEQWVFFDSMADRQGDQHGYNIPEVAHLKNFRQQMESDSLRRDMKRHDFSKYLKRLLSDAYICFYRPVKNRASSHMDTNSQTTHVRSAQGNGGSYSESNQSILQPPHSLGYTDSTNQTTFYQEPTSQQVPQKRNSNQRIEPEERRVMSQGCRDRDLSSGQQYDNGLYDQVANISTDKGTHQNTRYEDEIISQTTHVRSAQGNGGYYSESNQSILQPPHSLGHTDSTYQNTFNQEPTSQQVPQKSSSNQRIEPEERRVMSQGFGDRALSRGQQHDNRLYGAGKVTHQNTRCADEITDENRMDWESSENRGKCDSSQQSGGPSYYSTHQHSQNSGHLKDHGIDQQSRNDKSNQNIGQLSNNNSDRHSSYLSQDTRVTGVNQSGSRSVNIRSQGVSTEHEYENLKGQRSNSDMETSQQQTSTYPTSTYPPNQKARNKHRNEQQDERWTRQTTPGNSFTTIQDSPGSSTNYRKTAPSHSQRDGFEVNMTQNITPQCDSMSPHASLNRDQAGSSKGKSLLTPDEITSKTSQGDQSKGEMKKKNSEDDRSGNSQYSELRIDSSASDDVDMKSYYVVHLHDTSLAGRTDF